MELVEVISVASDAHTENAGNMENKQKKMYQKVKKLQRLGLLKAPEYSSTAARLLSIRSMHYFGRFLDFGSALGFMPFAWETCRHKLVLQDKTYAAYMWRIFNWYSFVYTIFIIGRFFHVQAYHNDEFPLFEKTIHFMWLICHILNILLVINVNLKKKQFIQFVNQFIKVIYMMEYEEMAKIEKRTKFEKLLFGFIVTAVTNVPCVTILILQKPSRHMHLISLLSPENPNRYWFYALYSIFEYFHLGFQWWLALLHIFVTYSYLLLTAIWLTNIKGQIAKSPKITFFMRYRCLQLLNIYFNQYCSKISTPGHKIIVVFITISTSYAITHFYHDKPILYLSYIMLFVTTVSYQYLVFPKASAIFKNSLKISKIFLPRLPAYNYQRRIIKSCAPLKIAVGSLYIFRPYTPLKFFKMELVYTMKAHFYLNKSK